MSLTSSYLNQGNKVALSPCNVKKRFCFIRDYINLAYFFAYLILIGFNYLTIVLISLMKTPLHRQATRHTTIRPYLTYSTKQFTVRKSVSAYVCRRT